MPQTQAVAQLSLCLMRFLTGLSEGIGFGDPETCLGCRISWWHLWRDTVQSVVEVGALLLSASYQSSD